MLFTLLARFFRSSTLTESLAQVRPWSVPKTNSARWCSLLSDVVQPSRHTNVCKISRLYRAISLLALDVSPLNYASLPFLRPPFSNVDGYWLFGLYFTQQVANSQEIRLTLNQRVANVVQTPAPTSSTSSVEASE